MADYKLKEDGGVIRYFNGANIPDAEGNRDWQDYLQYVTDGGLTDPAESLETVFKKVHKEINEICRSCNNALFPYSKEGSVVGPPYTEEDLSPIELHNYVADTDSILAVSIECASMEGTADIPVPGGVWKVDDRDVSGEPIYVPFTCSEFLLFKTAYYERGSYNFGIKELHKKGLRVLKNTEGCIVEDLKGYDYTGGWM